MKRQKSKVKRKKYNSKFKSFVAVTFTFYLVLLPFDFYLLTPLSAHAEEAQASPVEGVGQHLTLEVEGVSINDVFKILSKKSGLNIVAGKNVQGQVSLYLKDVPVREALKTILQSQGLASIEEGGIIKVMTEEEYIKKYGRPYEDQRITKSFHIRYGNVEQLATKLAEHKSPFGKILTEPRTNTIVITELPDLLRQMEVLIQESDQPQETQIFALKYTKVEDLEPKLKNYLEGSAGKLEIDKRSNRIIVTDIPTRIERVKALVEAFDVQVPQVLIEAKIVEVRLGDSYRQGINWEKIGQNLGSFNTIRAAAPLAISPPVGAVSLSTLGLNSDDNQLDVVMDLLEKVGKTNLLSSPRITVLNGEEAKLAVATRQPFVSQTVVQTANSTNTADNVQFVDVGVTLKVQPRISHDDYVELRIKPEVSSSNQTVELEGVAPGSDTAFTRTRIPVVTTQELETTVLVKSGTTLVIGGLIQDRQEKDSSKVPLIGSIPLLGRAFQSKSHDFVKTELVTFLTPVITKPQEPTQETSRFFDPEHKALPFEVFGDYPYRATYASPIRHAEFGETPYWEKVKGLKGFVYPIVGESESRERKF